MCGRFTLTPGPDQMADRFGVRFEDAHAGFRRFNVAPTEALAAVDDTSAARELRWGLVPRWARDLKARPQPINAKAETVASKGLFKDARRCLVLADGWYEWLKAEDPKQPKKPFRYVVDGGAPFAFAGLMLDTRLAASGCVLTVDANTVCRPVHDRMPAVLAGPDEEAAWLEGGAVDELCVPLRDARCTVAAANPAVNRAPVDDEGPHLFVAPAPEPVAEPAQGSLF